MFRFLIISVFCFFNAETVVVKRIIDDNASIRFLDIMNTFPLSNACSVDLVHGFNNKLRSSFDTVVPPRIKKKDK